MEPPVSPPGPAPVVDFLSEAARGVGLSTRLVDPEHGYLFELGDGDRWLPLLGGRSPLNDAVAARLAGDKFYTTLLLRGHGVRVPRCARCLLPGHFGDRQLERSAGLAAARPVIEDVGYPLVVKPNGKSHGRKVAVAGDERELARAVAEVWRIDPVAVVSEFVPSPDLRLDFLDGEYLFGYRRRPIVVEGDGRSTLRQLVEAADPRRRGAGFWGDVTQDPTWCDKVLAAGLGQSSVLAAGRSLRLGGEILNLHRWATATPIAELPPGWRRLGAEIGRVLRLRYYGVDLRGADLDQDPSAAAVLEVNASPLLLGMYQAGYRDEALAAQRRVLATVWETFVTTG